ncbi:MULTISPECIES: YehS family protein [unclassified Colwellia]|uniref:DUF1456 family protein n=1 Tax=unclassified Colwellia TaxID=196834 RepID=UPI0015F5A2B3|nr:MULTISPECIES: DUF1456 family protein [unclassified Colwellia]MBA6234226.1 DUF1456 family protein [Colwellia sp. MB02u-7]MBA6237829.1 DUF1456 family protein [Colwellia sp. MB02u-11]MBA6254818.1 DUF1456 family protein [Colwellia sp. MB3u-28]MBA6259864.1 DUF1456 family protein [Colwellia sp. MB3u-41]MBA6300920.1 DUF1456 family protein [Colwellia sp. MB3u-22]
MTNNDVLRRLRYTFNFNDQKMIDLFNLAKLTVSREQISYWLKKEDDPQVINCSDVQLATFLNGLIIDKRGARDGETPPAEKRMNNNLVLNKLKIALALRAEDVLDMMSTSGIRMTKPELSAFFRKPDHKHYRECKDQFLRNFIQAIDTKYHVNRPEKFTPKRAVEAVKKPELPKKDYQAAKPKVSKIYINPNATKATDNDDKPKRKVLKLKPSDIYKN